MKKHRRFIFALLALHVPFSLLVNQGDTHTHTTLVFPDRLHPISDNDDN